MCNLLYKKPGKQACQACGGRNRTRTCDPIDVNDVLYPCVQINQLRCKIFIHVQEISRLLRWRLAIYRKL